jgi:hypothetical protein
LAPLLPGAVVTGAQDAGAADVVLGAGDAVVGDELDRAEDVVDPACFELPPEEQALSANPTSSANMPSRARRLSMAATVRRTG